MVDPQTFSAKQWRDQQASANAAIALPNLSCQRRHWSERQSTNGRSSVAIANAIICMQTNNPA
jgi:hypothetical protein